MSAKRQAKPIGIDLGIGATLVAHGFEMGVPAIMLTPVDEHGIVGTPGTLQQIKSRLGKTVVLRFHNMQAILSHMERIKAMVETMQVELGIKDEDLVNLNKPINPEGTP